MNTRPQWGMNRRSAHIDPPLLPQIHDAWAVELGIRALCILPSQAHDEEVAELIVAGFGGVMTRLTQHQADYIGVSTEGPFKNESYKY